MISIILTPWLSSGVPDSRVDPRSLRSIQLRTEAAAEFQNNRLANEQPAVVVALGLSTVREGLDPVAISQHFDGRVHLLNLASSGGSFSEMRAYAEPLIKGSLRPDLVILGVHPSWLAAASLRLMPAAPFDQQSLLDSIKWELHESKKWLRQRSWILTHRIAVHGIIQNSLQAIRADLNQFYLTSSIQGGPSAMRDPWAVRPIYSEDKAEPAFLLTQLREWQAAGWFDARNLSSSNPEAIVLTDMLQTLTTICPKVVLILMPESAEFRRKVPSSSGNTLRSIADKVQPKIQVLDFREALPDSYFRDHAHLNTRGRHSFSLLIASRFEHLLPENVLSGSSRQSLPEPKAN
ncbi:hypothetical protein [Paucibacter sp. Y2R2-4]|uniref:hypothetical protein n=1 Tax=Paucibacter sp. Y2R2-4 TaxID=2893553 RepID=UPI0021E3C9FD|nr:hypothetical protein [Paucibacter sp. Y2R2-4]MCV2349765.1 hypothetical protein [Paucibacter sp. Y2R2-4]